MEDRRTGLRATIDALGPGVVFAGHRLEDRLGEGGMGVVFRARHLRLGRTVALKVIAPQWGSDPTFRELFEREARMAASVDHPHVIDVYDFGEVDGRLYLSMRFVEGVDLNALVRTLGRLAPARAADVIAQAAEGLDAAHRQGLVHRDVKPHNILVAERDGRDHVYVTDFGLTKHLDAETLTVMRGAGTPAYMAPEQVAGERVDARADVYSLGCVLYQLLTGAVPYPRVNLPRIRELAPGVAEKFEDIVARALAESPDQRYPSAGDLGVAAVAAAQGHSVARAERSVAAGMASPGNSPPLPPAIVPREELTRVRTALLAADAVGSGALGLVGRGGIGKTVLAAALARDEAVLERFPDGAFWVTVGEHGDLVSAQIDLLERLGVKHPELRRAAEGVALLRDTLVDRRCLLIVDDVWSGAAAAAFTAGPRGRVLYTTRDPAVLRAVGAEAHIVDALPLDAARQLLARLTRVEALPVEADRILRATGCVALALALVGAAIGNGGRSWKQVAQELDGEGERFLDHPYANTFKAIQVGVAALDHDDAEAYRSLAVYPEDTLVPTAAVTRLWSHLFELSPEQTRARLQSLAARGLLTLERGGYRFHDLQREFLLLHTGDVCLLLLHADLLAAYRALLPNGATWAQLPEDEPYIWDHLIYHFRGAGERHAVIALATDLAYLARRCFRYGTYSAESDLRQTADLYPDEEAVGWLLRLFTEQGNLFADQPVIGDLAATLASRLQEAPPTINRKTLDAVLPPLFLLPRWGLRQAQSTRVREGHNNRAWGLAFSPNGHTLASASGGGTVLWDSTNGQPTRTLEGHTRGALGVAFSPDGHTLASAGGDGTVRLWDPVSGRLTQSLDGHTNSVRGVAFSPDGHTLASASEDGTVRLWDPVSGQPAQSLEGHTGGLNDVAFSPDGHTLASAGKDNTLRLWDLADGTPPHPLIGHTGWCGRWRSRLTGTRSPALATTGPCGSGMFTAESLLCGWRLARACWRLRGRPAA